MLRNRCFQLCVCFHILIDDCEELCYGMYLLCRKLEMKSRPMEFFLCSRSLFTIVRYYRTSHSTTFS